MAIESLCIALHQSDAADASAPADVHSRMMAARRWSHTGSQRLFA